MSDGLRLLRAVIDQSATTELRNLTPDFFVGDEEHQAFTFVKRHYRLYTEMPTSETVLEETAVNLPTAVESSSYYYDRCYDRRMFNAVRDPFNELRTSLMENDAPSTRELISNMALDVRRYDAEQDLLTLDDMSADIVNTYRENNLSTGLSGITTGWPDLDEQTDGYQPGDLIFWVARPEVGKTHLLIHAARMAWLSGRKILFVSMEMSLKQIAMRFYAHHAGVDPTLFRKGRLSSASWGRVQDAIQEMDGDNRFNLFAGNFKGKRTDEIDVLIQELSPDIVFIDGFYIMQPTNAPARVDRISKVGYLADELKQIALQRGRPLVCTTQFSRDAGKGGKGGGLESIGFSDAIGQHASLAISIKMPPNNREARPAYRVIESMKGREGEYAKFAINFKFTPIDFSQAEREESDRICATESTEDSTGFMV